MKKNILIVILFLSGLISQAQNKKTLADSLYHHDNGEKIYLKIEIDSIAKYPNGNDELMMFLFKNIVYPIADANNDIQGTVYSSFIVEKNGDITNFKIIKGISESCDKEVIRLLGLLPNGWTPALKDGQPVRFQFILPIRFSLTGMSGK